MAAEAATKGMAPTAGSPEEVIVYEFDKNTLEVLRFGLSEFKGRAVFYCRAFVRGSLDPTAELTPTKKGITLSVTSFGEFWKGIKALKQEIDKRGEK